jgi:D-arabinose 1-dehydrogenase-like Zn-dependent alcohol dehydrogenase
VGSMQMFEAMNRAIAANGIKPVIDKVFGFDEVHAAHKHMASGAHFSKIVIRVATSTTREALPRGRNRHRRGCGTKPG